MLQKLLLVLSFTLFAYAQDEIKWNKSFDDLDGSKSFVLVEENYCPWCDRFKAQVLKDSQVQKALQEFELFSIMKRPWNKMGIVHGHVRFVPTLIFLDENKRVTKRHDGFMDKDEFLQMIEKLKE